MLKPLRGLAIGAACLATFSTADAKVAYVNFDVVTPGDGTTWGKAFKYLRDALDTTVAGDQIYLAKGIYYPDEGKTGAFGDREKFFELEGQLIYGGFAGTETSLSQRNPVLNETVLSGAVWQLAGEDVYWSLHVTVAYDSSTLDGVTVEQGNASGSDSWNYPGVQFYDEGGGCYVSRGKTLTLNNCVFFDNRALSFGGAIMVEDATGRVVATDCIFEDNRIPLYDITTTVPAGGAIKGNVTATNCVFVGNSIEAAPVVGSENSTASGGAIAGDVIATSSDFIGNTLSASGNSSVAMGGAIFGTVTALKCTFSANDATAARSATSRSSGGAIHGSALRAVNCVFDSNNSGTGVINSDGKGTGGGGAVFVEGGNTTITNSLFIGNTSGVRGGAIQGASDGHTDDVTVTNCTFLNNGVATGFRGSALSCAGIVRIMNNIFWHTADAAGGYNRANQIHVINDGVLRNSDLKYPTPATVAQNVVKGGTIPGPIITLGPGLTQGGGSDVFIGNASDTLPGGDPLFVNLADPDGADNLWRTADDGLRISTGSSALGTARDTRITTFRSFLAPDILDADEDANLTELLPADIASFVRVQSTYLDMGAYEFGSLLHLPEISVEQPLNTALVDGTSVINFGTNPGVAVSKVFTIRNTGPANLNKLALTITGAHVSNYTITQPASTVLVPGAVTSFTVAFKAGSVAGTRTATVHLVSNDADENPFDIDLTGDSLVPEIAIEQPAGTGLVDAVSTVNYGTVSVLASSTKTFTIRNSGLGNLSIASITSTGTSAADFKIIQPVSKLLVSGASTTFGVTFAPTAGGTRNAAIIVQNNDPDAESSFQINVTGNGMVAPEIAVFQPASTPLVDGGSKSFESVKIGLSFTKTFTIRNQGSSRLTNINVTLSGANAARFTLVKPSVTGLDPGDKTTFTVAFKPTGTGLKTALIKIASNDLDENPFEINIDGTGFSGSSSKKRSAPLADAGSASGSGGSVTSQKGSDGLGYLVLTVNKDAGWSLSKHSVEVSSNLVDWFSGAKHTTILADDANILRVRDNTPVGKDGKRYIRLK